MPRRRLPFLTAVLCGAALCAQTPTDKLRFDSTGSVTQRRILPPEPQERIDWEARVTALLKEEPGDIVIKFTPEETGIVPYTCWMGMLDGRILVVDDLGSA